MTIITEQAGAALNGTRGLAADGVVESAAAFADTWAGARSFAAGGAGDATDADADVAGMDDAGLLRSLASGFEVKRQVDALVARLAGEVEHRSRASLGAEGLAKRRGNHSAAGVLAEQGRITIAEAGRLVRVGAATAAPVSLLGERLPVRYPAVAEAVSAGSIPVDAAEVIVANLEQARPNADPADLVVAEEGLTAFAREHPVDLVRKLSIRTRDRLDTDGIEPREEALVGKRNWQRIVRRDGMVRYVFDADPLSAGYVDAWVNAHVGAELRKPRFEAGRSPDGCDTDPTDTDPTDTDNGDNEWRSGNRGHDVLPELRTTGQMAADAVVDAFRHGLSCQEAGVSGVTMAMVVRLDYDALVSGLGEAQIDGIEQPISAGTARRLAAEAGIIPMVLGGDSEVLDLGKTRRLFSKAQRIALAERDDGCAATDCTRPPAYTEAHHIEWWTAQGGPTDLANGILLCSAHHHRVHEGGWEIRVIDNVPWFIPPATIDITRTPRRGGRLRPPI